MRIYLLQSEKTADRSWLNNQQSSNGIQHIQWNHKVQNRSLPNDTLFNIQWALFNDGSTGGMAGADINADSAWNISTGGITIYGDTIFGKSMPNAINAPKTAPEAPTVGVCSS